MGAQSRAWRRGRGAGAEVWKQACSRQGRSKAGKWSACGGTPAMVKAGAHDAGAGPEGDGACGEESRAGKEECRNWVPAAEDAAPAGRERGGAA